MTRSLKRTQSMLDIAEQVCRRLPEHPRLRDMFLPCLANTWETTLQPQTDGTVFVITGDIPAMWLRDSAAQVRPYLGLAREDEEIAHVLSAVVRRQAQCVLLDPYANAFNVAENGNCHNRDKTDMSGWIWERKYELDSLCAPLTLAKLLWRETGRTDHLNSTFLSAAKLTVATIRTEQDHYHSPYRFERLEGPPSDTLTHDGRGAPVARTGMSWSGFRPSDDACQFNYLVPSNMLAVVALEGLAALPLNDEALKQDAHSLAQEIREGIEAFAKIDHPQLGTIYAYETDGFGNHNLMDDANVPSLLAMPYMGYCSSDDPAYLNTRAFVLSRHNPFYYEGMAAKGIGSPHTPRDFIWPISLCMQGLTSASSHEQHALLATLLQTDAGTGLMHEGFHKDDPSRFTRPWFAWANSLFAEFVMHVAKVAPPSG